MNTTLYFGTINDALDFVQAHANLIVRDRLEDALKGALFSISLQTFDRLRSTLSSSYAVETVIDLEPVTDGIRTVKASFVRRFKTQKLKLRIQLWVNEAMPRPCEFDRT